MATGPHPFLVCGQYISFCAHKDGTQIWTTAKYKEAPSAQCRRLGPESSVQRKERLVQEGKLMDLSKKTGTIAFYHSYNATIGRKKPLKFFEAYNNGDIEMGAAFVSWKEGKAVGRSYWNEMKEPGMRSALRLFLEEVLSGSFKVTVQVADSFSLPARVASVQEQWEAFAMLRALKDSPDPKNESSAATRKRRSPSPQQDPEDDEQGQGKGAEELRLDPVGRGLDAMMEAWEAEMAQHAEDYRQRVWARPYAPYTG